MRYVFGLQLELKVIRKVPTDVLIVLRKPEAPKTVKTLNTSATAAPGLQQFYLMESDESNGARVKDKPMAACCSEKSHLASLTYLFVKTIKDDDAVISVRTEDDLELILVSPTVYPLCVCNI